MQLFNPGSFYLALLLNSSELLSVLGVYSFLLLNSVPSYGCTVVSLSILHLRDIWIVSGFW